jgi:hypothetical protein
MTIKETIKKDVKIFGRTIPVFVLALIAFAGLGSAALLVYYGSITGEVTVQQAVLVDGAAWDSPTGDYEGTNVAGTTLIDDGHNLTNNAQVPATVKFNTTYSPDGAGITTTYRGVLNLTTKNVNFGVSPWTINGNKTAKIWYILTNETFQWGYLASAGFNMNDYTLIYYKDNSNRFGNPASAIPVSAGIGNLPYSNDGNVEDYDYCGNTYDAGTGKTGDNYVHCHGAKLWLVPTADIASGTNALTWTDASNFLFETDLIAYSANNEGKLTLPANGGGVNFEIVNAFDMALTPGSYTITTNILPA